MLDAVVSDDLEEPSALEAERFLENHPTAKIVVVIDTHCLENGHYIYRGNNVDKDFEACQITEVSVMGCVIPSPFFTSPQIITDCIPAGVRQYLTEGRILHSTPTRVWS